MEAKRTTMVVNQLTKLVHGGGALRTRRSMSSVLAAPSCLFLSIVLVCGLLPMSIWKAYAVPDQEQMSESTDEQQPQGEIDASSDLEGVEQSEAPADFEDIGNLDDSDDSEDPIEENGSSMDAAQRESESTELAEPAMLTATDAPEQPTANDPTGVTTWAELESYLNDPTGPQVFDITSLRGDKSPRPQTLAISRSVTLTSSDASAVVTVPILDLAEGVTLSLTDVTIQGLTMDAESGITATVRGTGNVGTSLKVPRGALVVGPGATVLAPRANNTSTVRNSPAAWALARVDVLSGGTVKGSLGENGVTTSNTFVILECEEVYVLGGSVLQVDIPVALPDNKWADWSPIESCRNVVVNGGVVKAGVDSNVKHSGRTAIKWCPRVTLKNATIKGGDSEYSESVVSLRDCNDRLAGAPVELRLDVENTTLKTSDWKTAKLTKKDELNNFVCSPVAPTSFEPWPATVRVSCTTGMPAVVNLGEGAVIEGPSVTTDGVGGTAIKGSDAGESVGVVTVNVGEGAQVRGGDVLHSAEYEWYRDDSSNWYAPMGGAAITGARLVQTGGSISGGNGAQGGTGLWHGYASEITGGTLEGGTGTSNYGAGGIAVTRCAGLVASGSAQVTGGESTNGQGGAAINDIKTLTVSDSAHVKGGTSTAYGGNGAESVTTLNMSGGTIQGGRTNGSYPAGPGIYWCGNVNVTGGKVLGGAGAKGRSAGGAAISSLWGTSFSLTDCEVRGGDGSQGGAAIKGSADHQMGLTAERAVLASGEGLGANWGTNTIGGLGGTLRFVDCTVTGSKDYHGGAAVYGYGVTTSVQVEGGSIAGGEARVGRGGPGISDISGDVTLSAGAQVRSGNVVGGDDGAAAIASVGGSLTATDATITGGSSSTAAKAGYGITGVEGAVELAGCEVRGGDSAGGSGGIAVYWVNKTAGGTTVTNCTITGGNGSNDGSNTDALGGDGIQHACYAIDGDLAITDSSITGGVGSKDAGTAVRNSNRNVTVMGHPDAGKPCKLTGGISNVRDGGYAVLATGGNLTVVDAELVGAQGTRRGGAAIDTVDGSVDVSGSLLTSAVSVNEGGRFGVGAVKGGVVLRDSTVQGGSSQKALGGAGVDWVNQTSGSTTISGCTITGGESSSDRGGFGVYYIGGQNNATATLDVENSTIVAGDGATEGGEGIATVASHVNVSGSSVAGGAAAAGSGSKGGNGIDTSKYSTMSGFIASTGNLTVVDSTIKGGDCATASGSGIYQQSGDISLTGHPAHGTPCLVTSGVGPTGRGIWNGSTAKGSIAVTDAMVQSAEDSAVYAMQANISVSGEGALIESHRDHTSGLFPGVWCKNLTLSSGKLLSHGGVNTLNLWGTLLMTGGAIAHDTDGLYAPVLLSNVGTSLGYDGSFAAVSGGSIDAVDGGVGIIASANGDFVQTYYMKEGSNMQWKQPATDVDTHASYEVVALASDGSTLPESAVGGTARIDKANPFANTALCLAVEKTVVTFDRPLAQGDKLICQVRDWEAEGEVWTNVDPGAVALANDASGNATATFTVPMRDVRVWLGKSVTGVSLDKDSLALKRGTSDKLTATVSPNDATDKTVTWSSSAPSVVTVDADGTVHALSKGTATITVTTADGGFTDTCEVSVAITESDMLSISTSVGGIADPEGLVEPVMGMKVSFVADYGFRVARVLLDGADITADAQLDAIGRSGLYELAGNSPRTLHVEFAALNADGMEGTISHLDGIEGALDKDEITSVLDAKRDFETMPDEERAQVGDEAADRLHELLESVPQIETVVEADADAPALALDDQARARLLYAVDGEDIAALQAGGIDLIRVKLTAYERIEDEVEDEAISALVDARGELVHGRYVDVQVKKSVYEGDRLVSSEQVSTLPRAAALAFPTDGLPEDAQSLAVARAHKEADKVSAEVMESSVAGGFLHVESDRFSVFDLLYEPSPQPPVNPDKPEEPDTPNVPVDPEPNVPSVPDVPGDEPVPDEGQVVDSAGSVKPLPTAASASTGDPLHTGVVLALGVVLVASAVACAFALRKRRR